MNKQTWTIAKMNLKNIRTPYFVTGLIFAAMFAQTIIYAIVMSGGGTVSQGSPSGGIYLWLLVIMAAIFIPLKNFRRIVNIGGKRDGFFWGSMLSYVILSGMVSLVSTAFYYTIDRLLISTGNFVNIEAFMQNTALIENHYIIFNLIELFGWSSNGMLFAFIQQFAFLLLLAAVVHTLTAMQDKWYGWVTDVVIAAILATFIPISVLRPTLLAFFNLIIFNSNAFLQILSCLILSIVIYTLSKPVFSRKAI